MFFLRRAFSRAKGRSSSQNSQSSIGSSHGSRFRHSRSNSGSGAQGLRMSNSTESALLDEFHQAVKENDLKKVEELIDDIGDVDATTKEQYYSALEVAVENGFSEIAELLLEYGASATNSSLMTACKHRNKNMAQRLLNFGADININGDGISALVLAARHGDLEIVRLLLDYGANVNQKTAYEYLPLGVRWSIDYPGVSNEECALACEPFRENTVLMGACREGHLQVVTTLLEHGVEIHATNSVQNTALHVAAYSVSQVILYSHEPNQEHPPCPDIVVELLRKGASVHAVNMFDETALDRSFSQIKCLPIIGSDIQTATNNFIIFCHLMKAGSPFPNKHIEGEQDCKALFKILLDGYNHVQNDDSNDKMCLKAFIDAVKVTVYCGIKPDRELIADMKASLKNSRMKRGLVEFLEDVLEGGHTLKQLCRIRLRQLIHPPLMINAMSNDFVFPSVLRQYILLDYFG